MTSPIERLLEAFPDKNWDMKLLNSNPNVSLKFKMEHPDGFGYKWCSFNGDISSSRDLTLELILDNPNGIFGPWYMFSLSKNPIVIEQFVLDNIEGFGGLWEASGLCLNPNISIDFVIKNLSLFADHGWTGSAICRSPSLTEEIILAHPQGILGPWIMYELSENPNISAEFIMEHPEFDWHFGVISGKRFREKVNVKSANF